jgi:cytochrome oxidase Cu insertion factor (SCO1/SenC/PrrC family)
MTRARALLLVVVVAAHGAARAEDAAPAERLRGVDAGELGYTYATGVFAPEYTPPPPGTYALPPIETVGDHPVLDADGRRTTLYASTAGRLAVVAFVYTTCVEAVGCPVSLGVLERVDRAVAADAKLARRVALVTISFDPERDRPARMATVRSLHRPRSDWRFLTTTGEDELAPLLADFGQTVSRLRFADGRWTGLYRHVLKVFLVDDRHRVRNVYSVGFLNPALVVNDLRTLLMERAG